jgi:kanamycin nucleotidyltransferase
MARGLKPHSHEDRRRVIERLIRPITAHFGDNLIALAATASFARGDDGPYSDLELTAFLQTVPEGPKGIGRIYDGLLVELIWTTRDGWLDMVCRRPGVEWYLAGSDVLQPIINPEFVAALVKEAARPRRGDCLGLVKSHWHEVHESTSKVLKASAAGDAEALALVYWDMVRHVLISLSFLNARPFTTFARMIAEARGFDILPERFEAMLSSLVHGFTDPAAAHDLALGLFEEMEGLISLAGVDPYAADLSLFEPDA